MAFYTVDGIKVKVNKDVFKDIAVSRLRVKLGILAKDIQQKQKEGNEEGLLELLDKTYDVNDQLYDTVFGVEQHKEIVEKLRKKHKGVLTEQNLADFLTHLANKINPEKK